MRWLRNRVARTAEALGSPLRRSATTFGSNAGLPPRSASREAMCRPRPHAPERPRQEIPQVSPRRRSQIRGLLSRSTTTMFRRSAASSRRRTRHHRVAASRSHSARGSSRAGARRNYRLTFAFGLAPEHRTGTLSCNPRTAYAHIVKPVRAVLLIVLAVGAIGLATAPAEAKTAPSAISAPTKARAGDVVAIRVTIPNLIPPDDGYVVDAVGFRRITRSNPPMWSRDEVTPVVISHKRGALYVVHFQLPSRPGRYLLYPMPSIVRSHPTDIKPVLAMNVTGG